ncbi:leishmanolysin-related zinc metalloendopeptidase [Kitasatospora sp. NPDC048540]|uniref:leishmanolysin-related zinc metalloendopeptidase n=1 Tax=unclassified Kitasatospora TaxID=2633591 RepID=UPI00053B1269|nr:leishmanolysin-related zinc metalloendopeptidase [Kitasatospora sp. MBT63]
MGKYSTGTFRTYRAVADLARAQQIAATTSPFTIEVRFLGGLTETQEKAFAKAADRWAQVIVGDLDTAVVGSDVIDDLLVEAEGVEIDGTGNILGMAGPTDFRDASAVSGAGLPAKGTMRFDSADLEQMEADGTLVDVITHEMGHVLGIGTTWNAFGLLAGAGTTNPTFTGRSAEAEFGKLLGKGGEAVAVPVANVGGPGSRDSHWRESVFSNELMSPSIAGPGNPLSRLTVASLEDIGYQVDLDAADPYDLPDLLGIASSGAGVARSGLVNGGVVLPVIPTGRPAGRP